MVNNTNVSRYQGQVHGAGEADLAISDTPLYAPEVVMVLLEQRGEDAINAWTNKCIRDVQSLGWDNSDLVELIRQALQSGRYINSQWCMQKPGGPWAACDSYLLRRSEWIAAAHKNMQCEYYVKFAIGRTGQLLLLASCHTPQY
ncbi:hypothetical protein [Gallionella capsiferriformans]|uniref:Uncharacterized protein n=1 Tax=Gallionella capsiferriformans (strain ES-2) TaxID=395494 RepID=D9SDK8_GALCS|nr:hypothetical protein [Gallionella capsiferriformans]ADL54765.1 hypothetical protein Galf_0727 [Gallionella capsiferriformans ES-2]